MAIGFPSTTPVMRFFLFTSLFLLLALGAAHAQTHTLQGLITDPDRKPIEGAVVAVVKAADSTFVKAALTDASGQFLVVNLPTGSFRVSVNYLGYQPYLSAPFGFEAGLSTHTLPDIRLVPAEKTLGEVQVTARKAFVEQRIDRVTVNPDALISNAGTTSLDVLEKSPGVQVDANGNISLRGRSGVVVFVDDKPTYLSAADLANYLRSLPAGSVEAIDIMTNPPARYDAAGNAGVINIRLKKTKARGFNGGLNLSYGQGRYHRSNNSANLNYRTGNLNFFGNASLNTVNMYQDLTIWREYFLPNGNLESRFTQNSYIRRRLNGATLKAGFDWLITPKSTFGVVLSGFRNPTLATITNSARVSDATDKLTARVEALSRADKVLRNGSVNLNFTHSFDSTGRELTTNVDYLTYRSDLSQSLANRVFATGQTNENTLLDSSLPTSIDILTAKLDYVHPLAKGSKLAGGAKLSRIQTGNRASFFDVIDGQPRPNYTFSNAFNYAERIQAGYLNYNVERGRLSVQTGLRFENTAIEGHQLGNPEVKDSSFTRQYNNLFPTVYATYRLDSAGKHQLGLSFSRRIDRPDYQAMNPFTYPLDRFTLYGGNPFLRPTFSGNLEISHTWNSTITTTLRYSRVKDVITETIEQRSPVFYSRPGNIGQQISYGVAINGSYQPAKWWTIQFYTEVMHNRFRAQLGTQLLDNAGTYWHVAPTNQFRLSATWNAELGGMYQTRAYFGQFVVIPVGQVRVAVSMKVLKNKGTAKLALSDVLYTNQVGGTIKGLANSTARWYSYLDSRVVTVSFSYRFSNGQTLKQRQTGGSDTEQQRVKS